MHISYYILHISPGVVARGTVVCGVVAGGVAMYNKHIHTHTHTYMNIFIYVYTYMNIYIEYIYIYIYHVLPGLVVCGVVVGGMTT
jgi:hypothetical protein